MRATMLAQMDSRELSGWYALYEVRVEEAEHQRDLAESGDGIVKTFNHPDDEDDEDDGET